MIKSIRHIFFHNICTDHFLRHIKAIRSQKRPIRFLLSRLLWHTGLGRSLIIRQAKYKIFFFPTALSATLWLNPEDRHLDDAFLSTYLQKGDVVIDVGANIGTYSLQAASIVGETGSVHSFEAHPVIAAYLKKNVALNCRQNITIYNTALGNRSGRLSFTDKKSDDQNAISWDNASLRVRVKRLDDVLDHASNRIESISLLKIDVEGYERFVLEGALKILSKCRCVCFEAYEKNFQNYGYATSDIVRFLSEKGFVVVKPQKGEWRVVSDDYRASECENLYAIRDINDVRNRRVL